MDVEIIGGYIEQLKEKFILRSWRVMKAPFVKTPQHIQHYIGLKKSNLLILGSELSSLDGQQSYQPLLYQWNISQ